MQNTATAPRRHPAPQGRRSAVLAALILVQGACALFFLSDVVSDYLAVGPGVFRDFHLLAELAATGALIVGIAVQTQVLMQLLRRQAQAERGLSIASGALHDLMESYFRDWGLTAAEGDVAAFALKGYSITEIAALRGTREGTVKTQLNAIYRKAGVTGRGPLVSLLIEDLMTQPLISERPDGQT
ncbi:helix-turn-helix transcriptional regulator [Actibacterium sp. D379-3]